MAMISEVERLVRDNISLVEREVRRLGRRLPTHVEREDLMSAGLIALVATARGHQGGADASFVKAACVRVRGALIDHLRGLDWASRSVRTRARELQSTEDDLTAALGRTPTSAELAEALGVSVPDVRARVGDVWRAATFSLQFVTPELIGLLVRERAPGPEELLLSRERIGYLRDAVEALPAQLRVVVQRCFFDERPLAEVAAELGVGESRVSHIRAEALALLRDGINAQLDGDLLPEIPGHRAARRRAAYFAEIAARGNLKSRLAA